MSTRIIPALILQDASLIQHKKSIIKPIQLQYFIGDVLDFHWTYIGDTMNLVAIILGLNFNKSLICY